jgi:PRTRC genetic system ThiF family protein
MAQLLLEPLQPLLVGEPDSFDVTLVGCGGTGSFLALDLARLAWDARQRGVYLRLTFVDHDLVELKNVGRQNFAPVEAGRPKAETLAWRFNRAFGLDIRAAVQPFDMRVLSHPGPRHFRLLVGAVDNAAARRAMADAVDGERGSLWWLDSGNLPSAGQVLIGNRSQWSISAGFPGTGYCRALPPPHQVRPGLLVPAVEDPAGSCAELVAAEVQSLMVNRAVAAFASQYLYSIVIRRRLDVFMTLIDLDSGFAASTPITPGNVAREVGQI